MKIWFEDPRSWSIIFSPHSLFVHIPVTVFGFVLFTLIIFLSISFLCSPRCLLIFSSESTWRSWDDHSICKVLAGQAEESEFNAFRTCVKKPSVEASTCYPSTGKGRQEILKGSSLFKSSWTGSSGYSERRYKTSCVNLWPPHSWAQGHKHLLHPHAPKINK